MSLTTLDAARALRRHLDATLDAHQSFQPQSGGVVPPEEQALALQSASPAAAEADTIYVMFLFNDRLGEELPAQVQSWVDTCLGDAREACPEVFEGRTVKVTVLSHYAHELAYDFE
jgi:hypothetical protein